MKEKEAKKKQATRSVHEDLSLSCDKVGELCFNNFNDSEIAPVGEFVNAIRGIIK